MTIPDLRRREIGMPFAALARRSGVSEPTVKRILGGQVTSASFANVARAASTLGLSLKFGETGTQDILRAQARGKAEQIARLLQGTSALEIQAAEAEAYERPVEKSYHELLAGPWRRLWS
jgi:transcriptional regulator with XRE-family HTH domain